MLTTASTIYRRGWGQEEKGSTEDEIVGWHHWHDGHGFRWTPGVGDGQGGLVCYSSWGHKESDTTEWLNWTDEERKLCEICQLNFAKFCNKSGVNFLLDRFRNQLAKITNPPFYLYFPIKIIQENKINTLILCGVILSIEPIYTQRDLWSLRTIWCKL